MMTCYVECVQLAVSKPGLQRTCAESLDALTSASMMHLSHRVSASGLDDACEPAQSGTSTSVTHSSLLSPLSHVSHFVTPLTPVACWLPASGWPHELQPALRVWASTRLQCRPGASVHLTAPCTDHSRCGRDGLCHRHAVRCAGMLFCLPKQQPGVVKCLVGDCYCFGWSVGKMRTAIYLSNERRVPPYICQMKDAYCHISVK